jgi:iron complex transport system substrate-binding protein
MGRQAGQALRPASLYILIYNDFHPFESTHVKTPLTGADAAQRQPVAGHAFADRTVTDQLGRQVTLPDHVTRAVVLQHQTLNLLVQLACRRGDRRRLEQLEKAARPQFARFMPGIEQLPTPGDLTQVNIESLLALHPQVVFVANYAPQAMIQQIQNAGIPVVAISLRQDAAGEKKNEPVDGR